MDIKIEEKRLVERRNYLKELLIGCNDEQTKCFIKGKIAMIDEIHLMKGKI